MCGIVGSVDAPGEARAVSPAVLDRLSHRGPDASGQRHLAGPQGQGCALGHTRLRVIDLSREADQPLTNEDGTVWVSYNGELYNHRELRVGLERAGHCFRSDSDTEVLVHLYEEADGRPQDMLEPLRGMFAFAIYDTRTGRLLLARDRLGIKPLYWTRNGDGLAFASEVRALAQLTGHHDPDPSAVAGYLAWGVVPGPRTIVAGVRELPPGCFLMWQDGKPRLQQWWQPRPATDPLLASDAVPLLRAALTDAVARHLVAERPVGVFLSSGVDSASVTTLAARGGPVRALTVTFPEAADEGQQAAAIARRAGADHICVPVTGAEVAQHMPAVLTAMDQPTVDGLNTWLVCRAARQAGLVVALAGLGGDELFGGYPTFRHVPVVERVGRMLYALPAPLRAAASRAAGRRAPGGRGARILNAAPGYPGAYRAARGLFAAAELEGTPGPTGLKTRQVEQKLSTADRVMLLELGHYLSNQLLRDTDQMSMAHSLEVRVPLLDDAVVGAALALPAKIRNAPGKRHLAEAAGVRGHAAKQPFTLPLANWLHDPLRAFVREGLLSETLPFTDIVPADLRQRVWSGFEAGRVHWSRPWALAVLRLWPQANGFDW